MSAGPAWRRWGGNVSTAVADQGVLAASHFVLHVVLARQLPPRAYGVFALVFAGLTFLMGAHAALLSEPMSVIGPQRHGDAIAAYLRSCYRPQQHVAGLAAAGAALAGGLAWPFDRPLALACWAAVATAPAFLWFLFLRRVCYVLRQPARALAGTAIYAAVLAAGAAVLAARGTPTPAAALFALAAAGAAASLLLARLTGLGGVAPRLPARRLWREHADYGRWILAANVVHWGGGGAFLFFVAALAGLAQAGGLRALQNLVAPGQQVLAALGLLLLPWLAAARTPADRRGRGLAAWGTGTAFAAAYAAVLWLAGPALVRLLYGGDRYLAEAALLPVFALYLLLLGTTHGLALVLRAGERPRTIFTSKAAAAVVALTVGLLLTARAGLPGAVWGMALSAGAELAFVVLAVAAGGGRPATQRARRAASLARQWTGYLLRERRRQPVLGDLRRWWSTTVGRGDTTAAGLPWYTFPAMRHLDERIRPGWRVFEWGSGGSTVYFARRGCRVTAVEHDPVWAARVESLLARPAAAGAGEAEIVVVPGDGPAYVAAIAGHGPASLDLVVVDGRQRAACLLRALDHVRPGGLLVLDDSEREAYAEALAAVPADEWEIEHFPGPRPASIWPAFSRTTVLRRRAGGEEPR